MFYSPQTGRWSFSILVPPVSMLCPHNIFGGHSRFASNPLLVKLPKSRITAHLHSFILLFSNLWNKLPHSPPSTCLKQLFTTISYILPSKTMIFFTLVNPPPSNFLFSKLKVPVVSILFTPCNLPFPSHVPVPDCCASLYRPLPLLYVLC